MLSTRPHKVERLISHLKLSFMMNTHPGIHSDYSRVVWQYSDIKETTKIYNQCIKRILKLIYFFWFALRVTQLQLFDLAKAGFWVGI